MFRRDGITMIELVITLAIVVVLAVMVVPNLGRWIQHYRMTGALRQMVSQMELAKISALKNNLEYRIAFDVANRTFELQRGNRPDGSGDWNREGGEFSIPRQVTIDNVTFPDGAAHFNPHGTAATGGVYLSITSGEQYSITVTNAGKINTTRMN